MKSLYLKCQCSGELLYIEHDDEIDCYVMSIWLRGYKHTHPWSYRLRCIWHIIIHGVPYGDAVILSKEDVTRLVAYLDTQRTHTV
jgi:hypothetical protein